MLVAIMPHVSDFAKKLNLPIPQPVTISQTRRFNCFPRSDHIGGRLILTNGGAFIFDHGRVESFESPRSYFNLQNPDLIPKFYGPVKISESQALQVAHDAIKKLGYTDAMLSADRPPQTTLPERVGTNYIARYRFRWTDPTRGFNPNNPPPSIEFEVDATTGQIQMLNISNPNTWHRDLNVDVHPPIIGEGPASVPVGPGRKIYPVSQAYSNAFLAAILMQCSQYVKTAGFPVHLPIALKDINMASYVCGLVDGDPMAAFDLKSGAHFDYRHGQVIAFYSSDVMELPGREIPHSPPDYEKFQAGFFGPINMTTDDAVALVRQTAQNLGYSQKNLRIDEPPRIGGPNWWGTNRIARCFIVWRDANDRATRANAEVDMANKTLKSFYINDHANTNIWREPPKVGVPVEQQK